MSGSELLRPSPSQRNASAVDEGGESGGDPLSNMEDTFGRSSTSQFPANSLPRLSQAYPTALSTTQPPSTDSHASMWVVTLIFSFSLL